MRTMKVHQASSTVELDVLQTNTFEILQFTTNQTRFVDLETTITTTSRTEEWTDVALLQ